VGEVFQPRFSRAEARSHIPHITYLLPLITYHDNPNTYGASPDEIVTHFIGQAEDTEKRIEVVNRTPKVEQFLKLMGRSCACSS
jgi:hypothetical protein